MGFLRKTKSSTPTKEVAHLAVKAGEIGISTPSKSSTATMEGRDDKPEGVVSPTAISSAGRSRAYSSSPVVSSRNAGRASPVVTTAGGMKETLRDLPTSKATNRSHSVPTVPSNTKEGVLAKKKTSERRKSRGSTPSSLPSTTRRHKERIQKQMSHSTAGQKTVKASGNGKQSKIDHSAKTKQTKNKIKKKKMDIMSDDDDSYSGSSDDSYSLSEYSSESELDDDEYTYDSQYSHDVHSYSLASDDDSESGEETDDDMPRKRRSRKLKKGKTAAKSKGRKSSGRGKGKAKVTNSVANFLKNMENYDIPESDNQVVLRVEEHGNLEKLMLQVSDDFLVYNT